jgi:hypothetical protein
MAMAGRRIVLWVAVLVVLLLIFAWIDGGEEPVHEIVQPVELPGAAG